MNPNPYQSPTYIVAVSPAAEAFDSDPQDAWLQAFLMLVGGAVIVVGRAAFVMAIGAAII